MYINSARFILKEKKYFIVQHYSKLTVEKQSPGEAFNLASSAHNNGKLNEAELLYRKTLRIDPNYHRAAFNLALVHHEKGQHSAAKSRIQQTLKKDLDLETQSLFAKSLAKLHQELGNLKLAIKYYKIALEGYPEDKDVLDNLGNSYASSGNLKEALVYFRKAVEVDTTELKTNTKLKLAHSLQDSKEMKEAMSIFEDILKGEPNNIDAMLGIGISLTYLIGEEEQGNKAAITKMKYSIQQYFNRAYYLEPQNPHVLLNYGIFCIEQGVNRHLGTQYISQALQLAPNDLDLVYSIAFLKFKHGLNKEALTLFEKVLSQDPKHTDAMVHIGLIHQENGDVKKALNYYRISVETDPRNYQNRNLYGMVLQETGNLADALDQFLFALKEDKKNWSVHMNLATIYRQLNQIEKSDYHRAFCIKLNKESSKMFEMADAENSETDASIDSVSWSKNNSQASINPPTNDGEDEYEVTPAEDDDEETSDSDDSSSYSSDSSDNNDDHVNDQINRE